MSSANHFGRIAGGGFLLQSCDPKEIFTPEDFTEQQQLIGKTAEEFALNEIVPNIEKMEAKDFAVSRDLIRKAADLGLCSVEVPEAYGGLEMDKISAAIIAERIAKYAGFATTWGAHSGIGLLPIVYFGSEEQKRKYLPKLASGEIIGAYALSEASSGSDALNCRARAQLSPDGKHYVLNGEKMWITNAGFAGLFTVFAKIDGERFTAFLVERNSPGLSIGPEEHKMGIRGSSTCPLILNDCKVPVENVLGEIGKGHVIAFNILNIGRFKLGAMCVGGAKEALRNSIQYAKERKAFGHAIADFGLIREKLAQMAAAIYASESLVYRTVGLMDAALNAVNHSGQASAEIRKAIEEYAIECSIVKVWASEMLDYVVDENVQIYGGYGFVEEYPAERTYRDARINRIFEGTNEINRLIITGFLLKRAKNGDLPLVAAIKKLMDEVLSPPLEENAGPFARENKFISNAKKIGLFVAGIASQKYMQAIQEEQEVMAAIADIVLEIYAMESATLRAQKISSKYGEAEIKHGENTTTSGEAAATPLAMARLSLVQGMAKIENSARKILSAANEGDALRTNLVILRRLAKYEPFNVIGLSQQIAQKVLERGQYALN